MPIPTINLIPAAYYLRKKVKVAWALAAVFIVAEGAGLVALGFWQSGVRTKLAERQTAAQTTVDEIAGINKQAEDKTTSVQDVLDKTKFIDTAVNPATGKNADWAKLFRTLADYTYPHAVVTSITPTAGSVTVAMHVRVEVLKKQNPVTVVSLMWANLRRCPIIDKVAPNSYGVTTADSSSGNNSIGGAPMPGMPGAGGPPMPGAPGRYIGSAISLAGPATTAAGEYNNGLLGGSPTPMPGAPGTTDLSGLAPQQSGPAPIPMYDVDFSIELLNKIEPATTGGGAQQQQQQTL